MLLNGLNLSWAKLFAYYENYKKDINHFPRLQLKILIECKKNVFFGGGQGRLNGGLYWCGFGFIDILK